MQILNGTRQQRRWVKRSINTSPDDMDISSSEDSDSEFADYIKKYELETVDSETADSEVADSETVSAASPLP